jgi:hypothetical protein
LKHNINKSQRQISFSRSKLSQEFLQDPVLFISYLPDTYRRVFEVLVTFSNYYTTIHLRQDTIAQKVGISREYCNKILRFFKAHGLIASHFRFKESCLYQLAIVFYDRKVRTYLSTIIRDFKWISWTVLLFSLLRSDELSAVQFTLSNINSYFIFKSSSKNSYNLHDKVKVKRQHNLQRQSQAVSASSFNLHSPSTKRIGLQSPSPKSIEGRQRIGAYMSELVSAAIRAVKSIRLSHAGQVKLSAYPDEAIKWADETIAIRNKNSPINEPFSYFNSLCMRYCSDKKLAPNWEYAKKLTAALKIKADEPLLLNKEIKEPAAEPVKAAKVYDDEYLEKERIKYSRGENEPRKQTFEEALHVRDRYIQRQKNWIKTLPPVVKVPEDPLKKAAESGPLPTKTWADLKSYEDIELELKKLDEYSKPEYLVDINKVLGKEFVANYVERLKMNLRDHPLYKIGKKEEKQMRTYSSNLNQDELYQTKLE